MITFYRHAARAFVLPLVGAMTLAAALPVFAADSLCPDAVDVKQTGTAPIAEWSVSYSSTPTRLGMVTFYNGSPKEEASLVYDSWIDAKDASTATWKLPKDVRGYWIKCSYRGTSMELSKALSSTISSCRVTYDRQSTSSAGLPAIKRIACQ
jgi:hypothetical protein